MNTFKRIICGLVPIRSLRHRFRDYLSKTAQNQEEEFVHDDRLSDFDFTWPYFRQYMLAINRTYGFEGKRVIEFGADSKLQCASAALALGAREVWATNPNLSVERTPTDSIYFLKCFGENTELESAAFDLIYGFALLEHVVRPHEMASETARLLKSGGNAFLSGCPFWLSPQGHHAYTRVNGRDYRFTDEHFLEPWEHLTYRSLNEFRDAMQNRVPDEDIDAVYQHIYFGDHISRLTASDVVAAFKLESRLKVDVRCYDVNMPENVHFKKALSSHDEKSLKTVALDLFCTRI